jgi:Calcineurin-like phosphoesterase
MFQALVLLGFLLSAPSYHRDWTAHPAIVERAASETIYALGDIHGDSERLTKLLAAAQIIPSVTDIRWNSGASVLVVTGDMIDKGPHAVDVIRLLSELQRQAPKSGGQVILLAGNHEVEFMADPGSKKAADFAADLKKAGYSAKQVAACETDLGDFFCSLPFAARVGDWFFSHGGNTAGRTIPQISAAIEHGELLTAPDSLLEARLGEGKDQWIASPDEAALLKAYAQALGVKHMVQGHQHNEVKFADGTVRPGGKMFGYRGLLYLIDVGMSRDVDDSHGAILRITPQQIEAIYPDAPFVRPL